MHVVTLFVTVNGILVSRGVGERGGGGVGFKIFERIVLFIARVSAEFLRMYVELSAALKIFENFLFASFLQLSDGFLLHPANQNARTATGRVVICRNANMALDKSAFSSSRILIGHFKRKTPDVTN